MLQEQLLGPHWVLLLSGTREKSNAWGLTRRHGNHRVRKREDAGRWDYTRKLPGSGGWDPGALRLTRSDCWGTHPPGNDGWVSKLLLLSSWLLAAPGYQPEASFST